MDFFMLGWLFLLTIWIAWNRITLGGSVNYHIDKIGDVLHLHMMQISKIRKNLETTEQGDK